MPPKGGQAPIAPVEMPKGKSSAPAAVLMTGLLVIVSALAVTEAILLGWLINLQGTRLERLSARQDMLAENFSTLAAKVARELPGSDLANAIAYPLDPESVEVKTEGLYGPGETIQRIEAKDATGKLVIAVPDVRAASGAWLEKYTTIPGESYVYMRETCLACDGGPGKLVAFDTESGTFPPLSGSDDIPLSGTNDWQLSPDKTRILAPYFPEDPKRGTVEGKGIVVYDLIATKASRPDLRLRANESLTEQVTGGLGSYSGTNIRWVDDDTIEYKVYDATKELVLQSDEQSAERSAKRPVVATRTLTIE